MKLFLITGIPLYLVLFFTLYFSENADYRLAIRSAGKGLFWFFPSVILYSFVVGLLPQVFEGGRLYFLRTFSDLFFPLALGLGTYLFSHRSELILPGTLQFIRVVAYLAGFFTFFSQYFLFTFDAWYEGYAFFLLPLFWMVLVSAEGFVVGGFFSIVRGTRFFLPVLGFILPFALGGIGYLYLGNYRISAWLLTLLVFGLSFPAMRWALDFLKR